jgi:hypothetical protein
MVARRHGRDDALDHRKLLQEQLFDRGRSIRPVHV